VHAPTSPFSGPIESEAFAALCLDGEQPAARAAVAGL
jgi:hypothetical protein